MITSFLSINTVIFEPYHWQIDWLVKRLIAAQTRFECRPRFSFLYQSPPSLHCSICSIHRFVCLSGGFTPSRHTRPSTGIEHRIAQLIQSGDDDYSMNETRRTPTTGRQSPSLFYKWHGILYMSSRTGTAGHTRAFDYPVPQTRLDIPRPLITQSPRHGWTYHGL